MTGGPTDSAPFAAYAVGSTIPRSGDKQAQILFANPDPNSKPVNWYVELVGLATKFPVTSGPANLQAMDATHPVVMGGNGDQTLDGFESDSVAYTGAGYTKHGRVCVSGR